jgi:hypothetical protein
MKLQSMVLLLIIVLLVGCNDSVDNEIGTEKINQYESNIKKLTDENATLLIEKEELVSEYNELMEINNELRADNTNLKEETVEDEVDIDAFIVVDEYKYKISFLGGRYLEDGIIIMLEAYSNKDEQIWIKTWNGIQVSELATHSEMEVYNGKVYIVVDGVLNIIDNETGYTRLMISDLGKSFQKPVIDKEGNIYVVGQYNPYLTVINNQGVVLWQVNEDEYAWADNVEVFEDRIELRTISGVYKFTLDGERIYE